MVVKVMMAEWKTAQAPDSLKTLGLGSCVAVIIYDPLVKVAAMAHVMLPYSKMDKSSSVKKGKYADTAIPAMVDALCRLGGRKSRYVASLVGGAQMFHYMPGPHLLSIGERNVDACLSTLHTCGVPVVFQETGGRRGRTVEFFCEDGSVSIKTVNEGVKV